MFACYDRVFMFQILVSLLLNMKYMYHDHNIRHVLFES